MKNINRKKEIFIWLLLLLPFIYGAFTWSQLPERIPTHFGMNGQPDDYSGKPFGVFVLPVMNVFVYLLLFFVPRIDPRRKNYELFGASYQNIRMLIHFFMLAFFVFIMRTIISGNEFHTNGMFVIMMIFFALLGNYFRTVRSNFFVGIRTPWTLSSEDVWKRTHELGGKIWFYAGLAGAVITLFLNSKAATIFCFSLLTAMVMIPVFYSYVIFKKPE